MCEDVFPNPQPSMVLGDMNFRLDHLTPAVMAPFTRAPLNFTASPPGMPATYKGGYVLDYCLSEPGVAATQVTPFPGYSDWEDIDHAPIAYRIS